jgi:hypothetical protein
MIYELTTKQAMKPLFSYALSKLFHDLYVSQSLAAEFRQDRRAVLSRYDLSAEFVAAILNDDVAALVPHVNGFLLRYYFVVAGMTDPEFIRRIRELRRG